MNKTTAETLSAAISVEQIFSRTLAAVLILREIERSRDNQEIRKIAEEWHRAIDLYGIDRPTPGALLGRDKEVARLLVDAVTAIVSALRQS